MDIIRIEKKNLVDEVYKQIREIILSGKWKEGDHMASENSLCAEFNVSRVVVREALQRLRAEHLIVTHQGIGSFVSNPQNFVPNDFEKLPNSGDLLELTEQDFNNMVEFRRCMEYPAIRLAAEKAGREDFERLQQAVDRMESNIGKVEAYTEADYEFHYAIVQAAHNPLLCTAMNSCRESIIRCFYEMNKLPDCHEWGVGMHRAILDHLIKKNAKGAVLSLEKHNKYNYARLSSFFKERENS